MEIKILDDDNKLIYEAHFYGSSKIYSFIHNCEDLDFAYKICQKISSDIEDFICSQEK